MRYLSGIFLAVFLFGLLSAGCSDQPGTSSAKKQKGDSVTAVNKICPIMGHKVDTKVSTNWNEKTVAFCCDDCIPKWGDLSEAEKLEKLAKAEEKAKQGNATEHK